MLNPKQQYQNRIKIKTVVCIVVYNRYANLRHWLSCWDRCHTDNTELVIIHNVDTLLDALNWGIWFDVVKYVPRKNIGYDIGSLQDVCKGRLKDFPEWDRLLWLTDDVFCMGKDFIKQFESAMTKDVGIACMEISQSVKTHIRTSAFMIDRTVAERLTFPADPITTKRQCYEFEHLSNNTLYDQVIKMGLKVVQAAPNKTSPLWDSGYKRKLDRQKEHEAIFGAMPEQPKFISKMEHLRSEL